MTPAVWDQTLMRIAEAKAMASGNDDALHSAHIRKLKRRKQWQRHSEKPMSS